MPVVAIYNNKGGEGKSTVTIGLAEFLSGNRKKSVLVIDLDAQASSSGALLGREAVTQAINDGRTIAELVTQVRQSRRAPRDVSDFFVRRAGTDARGSALADLSVLVPDGERMTDLEDQMRWRQHLGLLRQYLRPAIANFDFVLVDMPGNLHRSSAISFGGLVMSDFVLVPVKPTDISLAGLPGTFTQIEHARDASEDGAPSVVGLLRNATDRRVQQYRAHFPPILEMAERGELPTVFENFWPHSPAFESATDGQREVRTLKERFGEAYDQARKVTIELEERCQNGNAARAVPVRKSIWQRLGLR